MNQGPAIQHLIHRLARCPEDFLFEPTIRGHGQVDVSAVVSDLLVDLGGVLEATDPLAGASINAVHARNHLRLILVACWLLHDPWFCQQARFSRPSARWLCDGLAELASLVAADYFVTDPEHREELCRLCLVALDLLPLGESEAQATDRLTTISTVERERVVLETRAAGEAARELRRQMEDQRAREAAARVSFE